MINNVMAYSYWTSIIIFIPPIIILLLLIGYDKLHNKIGTKLDAQRLQDYSKVEILYYSFIAVVVIGQFIGGLFLLDTFEPISKIFCYTFIFSISIPFIGLVLLAYFDRKNKKGLLLRSVIFFTTLFPTLILFIVIYYNAYADFDVVQKMPATVLNKRIQLTKGGGVYLVSFRLNDKHSPIIEGIREKKVSRKFYEEIKYMESITIYIKSGALGIPWMYKIGEAE
ncbi:MAG: hypothetical protein HQK68_11210 [Desulfamplus sp.]|nr:hypothetical protein [Desulfamplus sp.]